MSKASGISKKSSKKLSINEKTNSRCRNSYMKIVLLLMQYSSLETN